MTTIIIALPAFHVNPKSRIGLQPACAGAFGLTGVAGGLSFAAASAPSD
jgi:hypothetical protein